jgi:hypothetical protein
VIANVCGKSIDRLVREAYKAALFWGEIRPTLEELDGELRRGQSCQQPVMVNRERRSGHRLLSRLPVASRTRAMPLDTRSHSCYLGLPALGIGELV